MSQQLMQENKSLKKANDEFKTRNDDLENENLVLRVSLACIESMYCIYI